MADCWHKQDPGPRLVITEVLHEELPEHYTGLVRARVNFYTFRAIELHCFRTLKAARAFTRGLRRMGYNHLVKSEDHRDPPEGTYFVLTPGSARRMISGGLSWGER